MNNSQLSGAIERILTVYVTWFLATRAKDIPGINELVPSIVIVLMSGGLAAWGVARNSASWMIARVAKMNETEVKSDGNGHAVIVVHDKDLSTVAKQAATPVANGK